MERVSRVCAYLTKHQCTKEKQWIDRAFYKCLFLIDTQLHHTDRCQSNSCPSLCPAVDIHSCPAGSLCSSPSAVPSAGGPGYWQQAGLMCAFLQSSLHPGEWQQFQQSLNKWIKFIKKSNQCIFTTLTFKYTIQCILQCSLLFMTKWHDIKVDHIFLKLLLHTMQSL